MGKNSRHYSLGTDCRNNGKSHKISTRNWKLYALDFSGRRQKEVPFRLENGRLRFTADTVGAREAVFAYELIR